MSLSKVLNQILLNKYVVPHRPFYKKYPFNGHSSIKSSDDRGCVDLELGFFCNRVPKAANSTIVTNLVELKLGQKVGSKQSKKIFRTPATLSKQELEQFDKLFKFAVVRDPFSRTLSAYLDKIDRKFNQNGTQITFKDFLYSLKAGKLHSNLHWTPQTSLFLIPFEEFDFIGRFENLNEDLGQIISRINGQASNQDFEQQGPPSTNASDKLLKYYDDECIQLMQELFAKDFELLGYNNTIK